MKTLIVLFNGIHLPYHVVDRAIEKAQHESYEIHGLFLKGKKDRRKGYLFPSDLSSAENRVSDDEAIEEDEKIITDNMQLVKGMVEGEKIPYRATLRTNASIPDIEKDIAGADLIIIDKNFDQGSLLTDAKVSLKDLTKKFSTRILAL